MSSYEGFFGDVRCESLFPFESMLSVKALATIAATDWQRPLTFLALKCRVQIFTASKRNGDPVVTDAASPILTIRISACKDQREKTRHGFWKKKHHFSRDWETPNTHSQVQRLRPQASSSSSLSNLPAWKVWPNRAVFEKAPQNVDLGRILDDRSQVLGSYLKQDVLYPSSWGFWQKDLQHSTALLSQFST